MKKFILAISFLFLITVSACGGSQPKAASNLESHDGVLTEQKNSDSEKGTHFIAKSGGEKILARSLTINLSNQQYLNNEVQVIGFLNDKDGVFEVTGVSVLNVLVPVADAESSASGLDVSGSGVPSGSVEQEGDLPKLDMELTDYESIPYSFKGKYPASWYYAGSKSSDSGILRHYGFSDKVIANGEETIELDVIAGSIPAGKKITLGGRDLVEMEGTSSEYLVYASVDGQNYRFAGPVSLRNLILVMAASIVSVPKATLVE